MKPIVKPIHIFRGFCGSAGCWWYVTARSNTTFTVRAFETFGEAMAHHDQLMNGRP